MAPVTPSLLGEEFELSLHTLVNIKICVFDALLIKDTIHITGIDPSD